MRVVRGLWPYVVAGVVSLMLAGMWDSWLSSWWDELTNAVLFATTLGISSVRDEIYVEAARGMYDRTGMIVLSFGGVAYLSLAMGSCLVAWAPDFWTNRLRLDGTAEENKAKLKRHFYRVFKFFAIVLLTHSLLVSFLLARSIYAISVSSYAEQFLGIVGPHASDEQRIQWRSRLAQSSTRSEFVGVLDEIRNAGTINGAKFPDMLLF